MTALQEAELHVRFEGGVERKADPKTVPAVRLLTCENAVFARRGSLIKRNGYEDLGQTIDSSAATVSGAFRMASRGDELLEFTPNRCYSRQTGTSQWSDAGPVFSVPCTERALVRTGTQQTAPDHATLSGVTVISWEDSNGGVWWQTEDASGRIFRAATQADSAGISPRCVPCGTNLHVYYAVAATNRIYVLVVNPATPSAAVTPALLTDDYDASCAYDACPTGRTGTPALIVWAELGTTNLRVGYVDQSGVLGSPTLGHPSVRTEVAVRLAATPVACAFLDVDGGNGDIILLSWVKATLVGVVFSYTGGDAALSSTISNTGGTNIYTSTSATRIALAIGSGSKVAVAFEEAAVDASNRFVVTRGGDLAFPSMSLPAVTTLRSVGLASRAWAVDSDIFAVFVHDTTYFNTYVSLRFSGADTDGFAPVGRHAPASASGAPTRQHLPSAHVDSDDVVRIALPVRERLPSENNDKFRETGIKLLTLRFDDDTSHQTGRLGAGLYMGGACPMHYDGRVWTEQGFHFGPELIATVTAGGGSMTSSTTYLYRCYYEVPDAQGEIHRGPVSVGTLVTMGGGDSQVTLTLPTLRVTRKSNVRIMVYRSLAGKTGDTARLFRVTSLDPTTAGTANGYVANSTSVDTVTFVDRMSDTTLSTFDEIYTLGGILSNDPPEVGHTVAVGKSRLFATDASDGNTVRFTQFLKDGEGATFAPELALSVDPFGGDITAIAARDDRVFVFKAGAVFTFSGDGPDDTGASTTAGFSEPQLLPGDVGCTNPASIVLTPQGFMFQSTKGIYRLNNDGSLLYVGAPVEAYNGQSIRRATVMPDRTQVVFLTDSGTTRLYDYLFDQWSTFTNHEGHDAAVVGNQYHYLRTDGRVFRETIGNYSDAGTRIRLRLETAWLHLLDQLQGFQKIFDLYVLGTWVSPHQLGVQYQLDYSPQWTNAIWYDATGLTDPTGWITGTGANTIGVEPISGSDYGDGEYGAGEYGGVMPGLYEWRYDLYEPCESIRFRFEDFEATGYSGASFELTELLLIGGVIANARRPATAGRSA